MGSENGRAAALRRKNRAYKAAFTFSNLLVWAVHPLPPYALRSIKGREPASTMQDSRPFWRPHAEPAEAALRGKLLHSSDFFVIMTPSTCLRLISFFFFRFSFVSNTISKS
jgi:hypothetical protein